MIFYHYPDYIRRKQLSMQQLSEEGGDPIALLPLLMQINPTIPVLHEHTGAGWQEAHEKNKWQWVVLGKFVLMSDRGMRIYHADLRRLLAFAEIET